MVPEEGLELTQNELMIPQEGKAWIEKAAMAAEIFEGIGHDMRNLLTPLYVLEGLKEETRNRISFELDRLALASLACNPDIPFAFKRTSWSEVFAQQDKIDGLKVSGNAPLRADTGMLSLAVAELIQNSVDAGGTNIDVMVSEDNKGGSLVEIIDDGSGLLIGQDSLFRPSNISGKRNKSGAAKGLSLGLFIAKTIIVRHGGSLLIENRTDEQKGTRVAISLPKA